MQFKEKVTFNIKDTKVTKIFRVSSVRPYDLISVKRMGRIGVIRFDINNMNMIYKTGEWNKHYEMPVVRYLANKYKFKLFPELKEIEETKKED